MRTKIRSFCFVYDCTRTAPAVLCKVYTNSVGYLFLLFISLMVFGDTNRMMSVTSPYAFLVVMSQTSIAADFGGLISYDVIYLVINL